MKKIIGIKYVSPFQDTTAYGRASANCIKALLLNASIPITLENFSFERRLSPSFGDKSLWESHMKKDIDYNVKIIHTPPSFYSQFKEPKVNNIGFLHWDADRIPNSWVKAINKNIDAQFVCCSYTKEALLNSGVKKPVIVIPPGFEFNDKPPEKKSSLFGFDKKRFIFYSIGQWIERKNLVGLLKAYFTEFNQKDKVLLALKTYLHDYTAENISRIKQGIEIIKLSIGENSQKNLGFPPIALITDFLSNEEMIELHNESDCMVSPHRGDGFGIIQAEAMNAGNPVVSTALGANTGFMNKNNSFLLPYFLTSVMGMPWIKDYERGMNWAEPNIYELKKNIRFIYENQNVAKKAGKNARETLHSNFALENLSKNLGNAIKMTIKKAG